MDRQQAVFVELALHAVSGAIQRRWWEVEDAGEREAYFIRLIINLHDALKILKTVGSRIAFTDEIDNGEDLYELVRQVRNSACHIGSGERLVRGGSVVFAVVVGAAPAAICINQLVLGNPHQDDVAVYYGARRIYLSRHIVRAAAEANAALVEIADREGIQLLGLDKH